MAFRSAIVTSTANDSRSNTMNMPKHRESASQRPKARGPDPVRRAERFAQMTDPGPPLGHRWATIPVSRTGSCQSRRRGARKPHVQIARKSYPVSYKTTPKTQSARRIGRAFSCRTGWRPAKFRRNFRCTAPVQAATRQPFCQSVLARFPSLPCRGFHSRRWPATDCRETASPGPRRSRSGASCTTR